MMMNTNESTDVCCSKEEIQFFKPRNVQTVMQKGQWVDVYPSNTVISGNPIEFFISGSADDYIDLSQTMLVIRCKASKSNGTTALGAGNNFAPINNFMHSIFSDVSLTVGDKQIEGGNFMYPQRAYFHNLLSYSSTTKKGLLRASGWTKDSAGLFHNDDGKGWKARSAWFHGVGDVEFSGPLCLDFLLQQKYLLNSIDVKIKLTQGKPEFFFMIEDATAAADRAVNFEITRAMLYVRRVQMTPSVLLQDETTLITRNALYPVQHTELITFTIANGSQSATKESLFRGAVPKLIVVGLVTNAAMNGSYATNPFNFKAYGVNHMALYKDGESVPSRPFTPDFANNLVSREYSALHQALELYNVDESRNITWEDFLKGYTLYAFNLAPDLNLSGHVQPYRDGNLRLEIKFGAATTKTINVVVMALFDGQIEITKSRDVICDFRT